MLTGSASKHRARWLKILHSAMFSVIDGQICLLSVVTRPCHASRLACLSSSRISISSPWRVIVSTSIRVSGCHEPFGSGLGGSVARLALTDGLSGNDWRCACCCITRLPRCACPPVPIIESISSWSWSLRRLSAASSSVMRLSMASGSLSSVTAGAAAAAAAAVAAAAAAGAEDSGPARSCRGAGLAAPPPCCLAGGGGGKDVAASVAVAAACKR